MLEFSKAWADAVVVVTGQRVEEREVERLDDHRRNRRDLLRARPLLRRLVAIGAHGAFEPCAREQVHRACRERRIIEQITVDREPVPAPAASGLLIDPVEVAQRTDVAMSVDDREVHRPDAVRGRENSGDGPSEPVCLRTGLEDRDRQIVGTVREHARVIGRPAEEPPTLDAVGPPTARGDRRCSTLARTRPARRLQRAEGEGARRAAAPEAMSSSEQSVPLPPWSSRASNEQAATYQCLAPRKSGDPADFASLHRTLAARNTNAVGLSPRALRLCCHS